MSAATIITNGEGATRAKGDALMFFQQQVHNENSEDQCAVQARAYPFH